MKWMSAIQAPILFCRKHVMVRSEKAEEMGEQTKNSDQLDLPRMTLKCMLPRRGIAWKPYMYRSMTNVISRPHNPGIAHTDKIYPQNAKADPPSCIAKTIPIGIYAANDVNRIEQHIPPSKKALRARRNLDLSFT